MILSELNDDSVRKLLRLWYVFHSWWVYKNLSAYYFVLCVFLFFIVECRHLPLQNNGNQQSHSHATYRNVQIKVRLLIIHRELSPWLVFFLISSIPRDVFAECVQIQMCAPAKWKCMHFAWADYCCGLK